jgi:Flp pilus assembly pilin Flp
MTVLPRLFRNQGGASAAEFGLVLPLLTLLLFAVIDAGRFMWEWNRAEKATQVGARFAVVTAPVLNGLDDSYSFSVSGGIPQGTAVPTSSFDSATCDNASCSCTPNGGFCSASSWNSGAFAAIRSRMTSFYPQIKDANVQIIYKNVGLGFAGDPGSSDVSPLVTVKLRSMTFKPISCRVFGCSIAMPDFSTSLTAEDLSGSVSN